MTAANEPVPDPTEPPRPPSRMPAPRADLGAPESALVRAMWIPLLPVRIAFMPLGWLFRIREPLPFLLRVLLPMSFLALIGFAWFLSTKGEAYLARGSDVSGIEDRQLRWEAKLGTPIELSKGLPALKSQQRDFLMVTAVAIPRSFYETHTELVEDVFGGFADRKHGWETQLRADLGIVTRHPDLAAAHPGRPLIVAVTLPKATYEARKKEVDDLFGASKLDVEMDGETARLKAHESFAAGDYEVEVAGDKVRLLATSHFGKYERWSVFQKARDPLEAVLTDWKPEITDLRPGDKERTRTIVSALVPKAVADKPETRAHLDRILGTNSYDMTETPDGVRITGHELVEERLISPLLLPSPKEMWESLPALIHEHWRTWDDAVHWWKIGRLEASADGATAQPPAPLDIDWKEKNEVPFRFAEWVFRRTIGPEWKEWKLFHAIAWSTLRIVMGFLFAALFAVPLGVIMATFSKPRAFFEPLVLMGSYLPLPALYPLTLFWWSIGEAQKNGFLAICTFVVLLPQVIMAIDAVPQEHLLAAETLGATRWQRMRFILLGGGLADIMRALRLSFAVGWTWIVLAEGLNPEQGLGWVISLGQRRDELRPHIYAVVLLIVILAYAINTVWARFERWLFPYKEQGA